jgi:hypothetical protein
MNREHLQGLIEEAEHPSENIDSIDQPPREFVVAAEEDFESSGFDVEAVPWGAIAMRAHELRQTWELAEEVD